jgi:ATP-dependent helicase/DNAse subunit B
MPLTLVIGPANSAKAAEVLGAFAAQRPKGALLVVPTAADARLYSRELAAGGSVIGGPVLTFSGLTREVAKRAGYDGHRLSELQRERLLRRTIGRVRLNELAESAQTPGFVAAAVELIAELERSLIAPERFARSGAGEVAAIYTAYARELERLGWVDAELYAWRALDALRADPGRWGSTAVFFYGFDDLTPLERDAIETLARLAAAHVTVSLTYEAGRAALAARADAVEELRPLAERVLELPATDEYYDHPALHFLERHLFEGLEGSQRAADGSLRAQPVDPGRAVRLLEAGGERAEIELVASEVLELMRDGVAADEIAVVFRHGPTAVVEHVFTEYGIPVAIEREIPFGHTTLGRGLLALARCALVEGAPASELIAYLRTPGVYERADQAEAITLREGIRTAAEARERLQLTLREIDTLDSPRELERQARRLFAAPRKGSGAVLSADEQLDARALSALTRALDELADVGDQPSGAELVELLESLTIRAASRGAVLVAEPLEIRAQRFRAIFVCGLQEGSFPAPGSPEPFLPDDRRVELAVRSGLRLRLREDSLARERYLFYSCVSRATQLVVLSYRSSDEEGNLELPSPFIDDVAELFVPEWRGRRRRRLLADVVWPSDAAPTPRERARAKAVEAERVQVKETGRLALGREALGKVRHSEILSAGALESYAECPVRWLVERELQPRALEPDPEPMVRGSVIHRLLERLLRELGRPLTAESLGEANEILDRLLSEPVPQLARGRIDAVRAAALRSIEADLRGYLAHEAQSGCGWDAEALELRFGFEDEDPSLPALELEQGVRVRGVVDRVDVDGAGHAIVRDYKSGGKRAAYAGARWAQDQQLQVALYMLAVRELMGLQPVAGLYQPLGGDDLRSRGVFLEDAAVGASVVGTDARSADELEEVLDDARRRAVALAAQLRAGDLEPCPDTCSRDGCKYPGICRSG